AGELRPRGVDVEVLAADLLEPDQLARVEERLRETDRPVDVLVNNAGYGMSLAFHDNPIEDEVRHHRIHTEVPMRLIHAALPGMRARRRGAILNVASVAAFTPRSTYAAAKMWQVSLSRWASTAYRRDGVTITAVCPGYTHTDFHARLGLPPARRASRGGCGSRRATSSRSRCATSTAARPRARRRRGTRRSSHRCGWCRPGSRRAPAPAGADRRPRPDGRAHQPRPRTARPRPRPPA